MDSRFCQTVNSAHLHAHHPTHRLREVFLIVMVSISVLSLISLIELKAGVGHGWGFFLNMCFGKMAFLIPAVFTYVGFVSYSHWYRLATIGRLLLLKFFGLSLLFVSLIVMVQTLGWQGGYFGQHLLLVLQHHFYPAEVWVGLLSMFWVGMTLVSRLSWHSIVSLSKTFFLPSISSSVPSRMKEPFSYPGGEIDTIVPAPIQRSSTRTTRKLCDHQSQRLIEALRQFGIVASISNIQKGPVVTRFELDLSAGTKSASLRTLHKDIARALAVEKVRVIEVIAGTSCVGIELPNENREFFDFEQLPISSNQIDQYELPILLGKTALGETKIADLATMPHLLIAGSTQSGKTMLLQSMLLGLTGQFSPDDLQLILIDPKCVAFSQWQSIPHLANPIITRADEAINALSWCVEEMERRYQTIAANLNEEMTFPKLVVVVDEMSDLIMTHKNEIEGVVCRLAQKARQSGIHLILSTQRPSADVITGHIKSNMPVRIALSVAERRDSRIILDESGAETLLGSGDMLFKSWDRSCERLHAPFVSDECIRSHIAILNKNNSHVKILNTIAFPKQNKPVVDVVFDEAVEFIKETGRASTSSIQRKFRIGFQRASNIIDKMEEQGIISEKTRYNGPREVLVA